jgi:hypothetical protein
MSDERHASPDEPAADAGNGKAKVGDHQPIGTVLDFTRAPRRAPSATRALTPKAHPRRRWKRIAVVGAALAAVAALVVLAALDIRDYLAEPPAETSLPAEVRGAWYTSAPQYATRRFELLSRVLLFQVGGAASLVTHNDIVRVRRYPAPGGTLFHVEYVDAGDRGAPLVFDFIYHPREPAVIVFPNQHDVVWMRVRRASVKVVTGAADISDVVVPARKP